jgi:Fic-DOC domain mobile mystery protein B
MTDALVPIGDDHTELSEDDRLGLIPTYIATRGQLFEAEQRNIAEAMLGRHPTSAELLDDTYLRQLHRVMFGKVWRWAGTYRRRETNIGIDPIDITVAVRDLVRDATNWTELGTYEPDELAIRFHHRMVAIHPFPNGNGRHGRIAADYLVTSLGHPAFTWGSRLDVETDELRRRYIEALHDADDGDISGLIEFARN